MDSQNLFLRISAREIRVTSYHHELEMLSIYRDKLALSLGERPRQKI